MKSHGQTVPLPFNHRNPEPFANRFESGILQEVHHRGRKRPKSVFELFCHVRFFLIGLDGRYSFVGPQAQILARNIILRDSHVESQAQRRAQLWRGRFALKLRDGALQHLRINIESHGFDVAVLLPAQHIACATQLQIQRGNPESRSEFAELFHR